MNHSISSTITGKTKIKIVFLGGQAVGKSSIIEKYIHNRFDQTANPTVGIDFLAKNVTHKAKNYRLQLWDTAGQQRFRSLIPSYLKDAHCALIVFDVTSKNSLNQTQMWLSLFNQNKGGQSFVFLVGNKIDLDYREVTAEEGRQKAEKFGLHYFQISAKTGTNIQQLFFKLIDSIVEKTAHNYVLQAEKKQSIIKEQAAREQDESNQRVVSSEQGGTKLTAVEKQGVQVSENVVLRNEKVTGKQAKAKGCC